MDPALEFTDPPRPVPPDVDPAAPLVTLAWRALHAEHCRRAVDRQQEERAARRVRAALAGIADEVHRLRGLARQEGAAAPLLALADRLEETLADVGVVLVAPEGEPYSPGLMELLENVAQRPEPGLDGPRVAEVIAPAVLDNGALVRPGKAVIAVPETVSP